MDANLWFINYCPWTPNTHKRNHRKHYKNFDLLRKIKCYQGIKNRHREESPFTVPYILYTFSQYGFPDVLLVQTHHDILSSLPLTSSSHFRFDKFANSFIPSICGTFCSISFNRSCTTPLESVSIASTAFIITRIFLIPPSCNSVSVTASVASNTENKSQIIASLRPCGICSCLLYTSDAADEL